MGLLHKRARLPWARRAATALFAAAFLFAAGVEYGKRAARGAAGDLSPVAEVQRAGSAYVAALMRLSETASPDSARLIAAGLEVGTSTLRAAALSAARMHPDNLSVLRIRDGLEIAADYSAAAPQRGGTFLVF
jgi:hypothetical protein